MATDHVTPTETAADEAPLYTFDLNTEIRKLAQHATDVLEMLPPPPESGMGADGMQARVLSNPPAPVSDFKRRNLVAAVGVLVAAIEDYVPGASG